MKENVVGFRAVIAQNYRHILVDAGVLLLIYFLPALSHIAPFPLYVLEPMRIGLLGAYLLSGSTTNILLLAGSLPFFSLWASGHPPFFKAMLIAIELMVNMGMLIMLLKQFRWPVIPALAGSILISKVIYYGLKYLFLHFALLSGSLVSTGLSGQGLTILGQSLIFSLLYYKFFKQSSTSRS